MFCWFTNQDEGAIPHQNSKLIDLQSVNILTSTGEEREREMG